METQWFNNLLKEHYGSTIKEILDVKHEPAIAKGENFASEVLRYKIVAILNSGKKITKHFIVKIIPDDGAFSKDTPIFKNEIMVYSVVLKEMEKLMNEFNDTREKLWCEFIGFSNSNKIVLEDLTVEKFVVMDRVKMLDFEHSVHAVRSLARYHAMSAIILKRKILKPTDFATLLFVSSKEMIDMFFVSFFSTLAKTVKNYWGSEWSHLPEHLYKASETALKRYKNMAAFSESRFNVINHGDCWTNNLMFKHKPGTNTPIGLRFIDYQMGHCNSFAWDLTYFLYNSTLPDIRRTTYYDLLEAYHASLQESLEFYLYPKDEIPTLTYVIEEMERLKFFGFGLLTSIHAFTSTEVANCYDIDLSFRNKLNPAIGINTDIFTCKKYRRKVEEDMQTFIDEEVI